MMQTSMVPNTRLSHTVGTYRGFLYYKPKKPERDWNIKCRIEEVLRIHPSYGSRRLAIALHLNRKRVKRVMNLFGIKPYRWRGRRWKKSRNIKVMYPNLLLTNHPQYPNHIWTADFTHVNYRNKIIYIATVLDLYTRRIIGLAVYTTHAIQLTLSALMSALHTNPRPIIFHSDNGSEYNAEVFINALTTVGTSISRSAPGCPWENGYQESFHSQFKVDLGDPNRFNTLGELVYTIYQTIYTYNHTRIHSALKMPPVQFAQRVALSFNSPHLLYKVGV